MTTIAQCLNKANQLLQTNADINAKLEAEVLLAFVIEKPRSYLYTWPEQSVDAQQLHRYDQLVNRRIQGEPIAYITGQREFWGLPLHVSPATLIPRHETERLVELALHIIPEHASWTIADLGTGSGALAIAIANERPHCHIIATDQSDEALAIARHNAKQLNINCIEFSLGNWYEPLATHKFDLIVSNPPYVAEHDPHLKQGDLRYEPSQALCAGDNGLQDIRAIIKGAAMYLKPRGWLLLEHGFDQGRDVCELLKLNGFNNILCHQDYAQHERASQGQLL